MKFTVEGFNQKKLIEYNMDIIDAAILRYFVDFRDSGNMLSKIVNEKQYNWVRYEAIIEALPILNLNKPDSVYRRLRKMTDSNVLESITVKQGGVFSFYRTGSNYSNLISDTNPTVSDKNPRSTDVNPNESDENPEQNINLLYSSINNSSINNICKEIIDYLNEVVGSSFKHTTKDTQKLIKARLNEKFTIDNFKKVIDNKYSDWKGTEYAKYLVPSTLFAGKFETYLNQRIIKPKLNSNGKPSTFNNHSQRENSNISRIENILLGREEYNADERF